MNLPPKEGVGNAGCPLHPQPRVHFVGWVEPAAKPIIYANCDDGYRWRSPHPTSTRSLFLSPAGLCAFLGRLQKARLRRPIFHWHEQAILDLAHHQAMLGMRDTLDFRPFSVGHEG